MTRSLTVRVYILSSQRRLEFDPDRGGEGGGTETFKTPPRMNARERERTCFQDQQLNQQLDIPRYCICSRVE